MHACGNEAIVFGVCAAESPRRPRRILLATSGLFVGGGIASVSRCIARALGEEAEAGRIEPFDSVSLGDAPGGAPAQRGVHLRAGGSQARFAFQVWRAVRRRAPDLVLFDHAGLARAAQLPLPGLPPRAYGIFAHGGELEVITGGWRRRAFEGARIILTNSRFTADFVRRRFPATAERVRPVPLCIDPDLLDLWERDTTPTSGVARTPAVLIVGRLWASERGKGHDALLAALPLVRERVPDAELWIVGKGDDQPRLESLARAGGVGGAVRFLGAVSDAELGRLYRRAGVFAMPSRQEGFGLVYAEAMWHGLPCIGSTRDAASEVISEGETGLLVPYGAPEPLAGAIVSVLTDPDRAGKMGRAAAAEARRRFTYARFRQDLLTALGLSPSEAGALL